MQKYATVYIYKYKFASTVEVVKVKKYLNVKDRKLTFSKINYASIVNY